MWARLDNDITRVIGLHTIKRIISAVRDSHHGGTAVISQDGNVRFVECKNEAVTSWDQA